jgi:hypothetical protein
MNIKPVIYENLTVQQRIAATIEALARDDDAEHERLASTCPKIHYKQADYLYSGTLQSIVAMAISTELEMTSNALSMTACCCAPSPNDELIAGFHQRISDCYAAWNETLGAMGIDPEAVEKLAKPMRHPVVATILTGELPDADPEQVRIRRDSMEEIFKKIRNV